MENTLENKAKFFALYWGLDVFKSVHIDKIREENRIINSDILYSFAAYGFIELTPLSHITDEDLKFMYPHSKESMIDYFGSGNEELAIQKFLKFLSVKDYDYLRSKGYALPYLDTTVEQQIEFGWIKLKEN